MNWAMRLCWAAGTELDFSHSSGLESVTLPLYIVVADSVVETISNETLELGCLSDFHLEAVAM